MPCSNILQGDVRKFCCSRLEHIFGMESWEPIAERSLTFWLMIDYGEKVWEERQMLPGDYFLRMAAEKFKLV